MQFYLVLTLATLFIVVFACLLWLRTRNVTFPFGIMLIYYWTIYGGWSIVADRLRDEGSGSYGYLEEKLFPINLDHSYFWALVLYSVFVVTIQISLLALLPSGSPCSRQRNTPIRIKHFPLLLLSGLAGVLSYLFIRADLENAAWLNVSAYALTRARAGETFELFTIHQLLNRACLISSALGLAVVCSGQRARLFIGTRFWLPGLGYASILSGMFWLALLLGNKNELVYAGLSGILFYTANAFRPRRLFLALFCTAGILGLWLVDLLRGLPLSKLAETFLNLEADELMGIFRMVSSGTEAFAAHFSLYGALAYNIPMTWGSSFISLASSFVPRIVSSDRPADIYQHYVEHIGATEGQGYTIHHASGWYLNFGIVGVILGGVAIAWLWATIYKYYLHSNNSWSLPLRVLSRLAPWTFVAYLPMVLRAGPEVYKAVIFEAILLPVIPFTLSCMNLSVTRTLSLKSSQPLPSGGNQAEH